MRTINAPGVEIKEIDKSGYSPALTGTACYVLGFSDKGEAYSPMEFSSRTAWTSYYGEPDNEAERYFYGASVEVLNQGGRLFCARLPYDNEAFEKMPGVQYDLTWKPNSIGVNSNYPEIAKGDPEIKDCFEITSRTSPTTYSLKNINDYKTSEKKVAAGSFVIVDTTGGTYKKVQEDNRKGQKREVIGIIPVVTTAANALYAQSMIDVDPQNIKNYESITGSSLNTLVFNELSTTGLTEQDLTLKINTENFVKTISFDYLSAIETTPITGKGELSGKTELINTLTKSLSANIAKFTDINAFNLSNDVFVSSFGDPALEVKLSSFTQLKGAALSNVVPDVTNITFDGLGNYSVPQFNFKAITKTVVKYRTDDTAIPDTLCRKANSFFSTIPTASDGDGFDSENLKKVGVVVFKAYLDASEGNKVGIEVVESFVGSLYKDDKDPNTGVSTFIDTIINGNSKYINLFSNCFSTPVDKNMYLNECDILIAKPSNGFSLGFYSSMTAENISVSKSILQGMDKCFDKVSDVIERDIDIVPDAGISNIAQYITSVYNGKSASYDLDATNDEGVSLLSAWKCDKDNVKMWKAVIQKLDTFCKKIRKDCAFIADGPRPLVLQGQKKVIRPSCPDNTIDTNIIPLLKYLTGFNTNFGAGYLNWFEVADDFTGDLFWIPPSIKAMGVWINTDVNFAYWEAPAGLNRGVINATDVSFSPSMAQAGAIYEKNWNYAIKYPQDGIVLEGQKTFQVKPSAFDRVSVRRTFLRLERPTYKTARYYVYEGNTAYTRQRLVDAITPFLKDAKVGGGIYDYRIKCDDDNNTADSIDRNELKVSVGIKPTKTAEFILIDFIALSTGGSFEEAGF